VSNGSKKVVLTTRLILPLAFTAAVLPLDLDVVGGSKARVVCLDLAGAFFAGAFFVG
jgi:hypothetical protein